MIDGVSPKITDPKIASYEEVKVQLFDLYRRFRYGEIVSNDLMSRAARVEKWVRWSILAAAAIALVTGAGAFFNPPFLAPVWALFGALSTLLAIYSVFVGSGEKQFSWFGLAGKFQAGAVEIEFFSKYVKLGKITEDELLQTWKGFSDKLNALLGEGKIEYKTHEQKHGERLKAILEATLKHEGKMA